MYAPTGAASLTCRAFLPAHSSNSVLGQQAIDRFAQQYGLGNARARRQLVQLFSVFWLEAQGLQVLTMDHMPSGNSGQ